MAVLIEGVVCSFQHIPWSRFLNFSLINGHVVGTLGPQRPAMSQQHSFTYSVLRDRRRRDQTAGSEFYGNFSSGVSAAFDFLAHAGGQTELLQPLINFCPAVDKVASSFCKISLTK